MLDELLNFIAPHRCCSCGEVGVVLCDNCKYDIVTDAFSACLACRRPTGNNGICKRCRLPYERAWCVGERREGLERLIDAYKFERAKSASRPLADLLIGHLPDLPKEVVIVPIPTVNSHIRQRGYDHTWLIARQLARAKGLTLTPLLGRATSDTQHGASRTQRLQQAKRAFTIQGRADPEAVYMLIDDIMTTGATLEAAANKLREHGARHVWVAVIARQPLD